MTQRVLAPWDWKQIACLNAYQNFPLVHPYTCECQRERGDIAFYINNDPARPVRNEVKLLPSRSGWYCLRCEYKQNWANYFATVFDAEVFKKNNSDLFKMIQKNNGFIDDFLRPLCAR